jgi:N-acetylglucosamine kinase-like BadF-type ATPase
VGVDVGASHIEAAAATEEASPISRVRRPGVVVKPGQVAPAAKAISTTIDAVFRQSRSSTSPDCIVVGAAGTHNEALRSELENMLQRSFPSALIRVTTDGAIALEAAFGDKPGIVVCSGSGSIAYARTPDGEIRRVGGLGPELADEGSGYAIGRAGLRVAARAADGRSPTTSLAVSIPTAVGVKNLDQLIDWAWEADRPAVAALARSVCREALSGDDAARAIVITAANDLGQLVMALARLFGELGTLQVAVSGGILGPESPVKEELVTYLRDQLSYATVVEGTVDPVLGALSMASRLTTR